MNKIEGEDTQYPLNQVKLGRLIEWEKILRRQLGKIRKEINNRKQLDNANDSIRG